MSTKKTIREAMSMPDTQIEQIMLTRLNAIRSTGMWPFTHYQAKFGLCLSNRILNTKVNIIVQNC